MDNKYTPGPWILYNCAPRGGKPPTLGVDDAHQNPIVHWSGFDAAGQQPGVKVANARLIAAAPDLLEALRELLADYRRLVTVDHRGAVMADAALAKAQL